jgi:formylglycine-generating enzyme required for sulfatase activity
MVFVPPGRFAFGSGGVEAMRSFHTAVPMHEVETGAYLIGRYEVTFADWIAFLEDLSPGERAARTPRLEGVSTTTVQTGADLTLTRGPDGVYTLDYAPAGIPYRARAGEPIVYRDRTKRATQDWRRFPVSGVSVEDAIAYVGWLDRTARVPGARLCTEREWERAARGVDGRAFPRGETLAPDDANVDVTYGQRDGGFGVDEVGSHPGSTSVHGLDDMSGNVWEITRAVSGHMFATRGGTYYHSRRTAHLANRNEDPASYRHLHVGFRICADAP